MDFQLAYGSPAVFSKAKAPSDSEGKIHPNRLSHKLQARMKPDAAVVADGGDFLSVARVSLSGGSYLDPGSLGCMGVGKAHGRSKYTIRQTRMAKWLVPDDSLQTTPPWRAPLACMHVG